MTWVPEIRGWKYKTKDNRLCVYACDFFSVTPEMIGEVDAVYDRGSLEAINVGDRQGYVKLMQSLIGKDFRYVLNAYEYDDSEFQGPPRIFQEMKFSICLRILLKWTYLKKLTSLTRQ